MFSLFYSSMVTVMSKTLLLWPTGQLNLTLAMSSAALRISSINTIF